MTMKAMFKELLSMFIMMIAATMILIGSIVGFMLAPFSFVIGLLFTIFGAIIGMGIIFGLKIIGLSLLTFISFALLSSLGFGLLEISTWIYGR